VSLSLREARRLALAAQGFGARPARTTLAQVRRTVDKLGVVQIDSVNVLCRSQELPLWARLGSHARDSLPRLVGDGVLFEYWGHEASLLPVEMQPLFRWRMAEAKNSAWKSLRRLFERDPRYVDTVRSEVHARGGLAAGELEERENAVPRGLGRGTEKKGGWWGWDDRKRALEYLFWTGEVTATRRGGFERVYVPLDRVLPRHILDAPTPRPADAQRALLLRAAGALGVATAADLADYFRINKSVARPLVEALASDGELEQVSVESWSAPAFKLPKFSTTATATTVLSPFDSLVWYRERTERLFGFRYRLEIYTPAEKRTFGYYVLPFLLDGDLVARADLKADRQAGVLRVHGAFAEPGAPKKTASALYDELTALAKWLGLDGGVAIARRGNLSSGLLLRARE
jgi:uncharacterized protein YcaQ